MVEPSMPLPTTEEHDRIVARLRAAPQMPEDRRRGFGYGYWVSAAVGGIAALRLLSEAGVTPEHTGYALGLVGCSVLVGIGLRREVIYALRSQLWYEAVAADTRRRAADHEAEEVEQITKQLVRAEAMLRHMARLVATKPFTAVKVVRRWLKIQEASTTDQRAEGAA